MPKATLTIEDGETTGVFMTIDFDGGEFVPTSRAHQMVENLAQSVLMASKSVEEMDKEQATEAPKIITGE